MAKEYKIIYDKPTYYPNEGIFETKIDTLISKDVQFKDQYIQIDMEDSENTVLYIPYYRIYNIKRTGQDPVNDDYMHP